MKWFCGDHFHHQKASKYVLCFNLPSINILQCFAVSIFALHPIIASILPPPRINSSPPRINSLPPRIKTTHTAVRIPVCLPQISFRIFVFPHFYVAILIFVIIPSHAIFYLPAGFSGPCLCLPFRAYTQTSSSQSDPAPIFQLSPIYVSDECVSASRAWASFQVRLKEEQETVIYKYNKNTKLTIQDTKYVCESPRLCECCSFNQSSSFYYLGISCGQENMIKKYIQQ